MANVTVYSTATCPYCVRAKDFLKANNIEFTNIDVSNNEEAAKQMAGKTLNEIGFANFPSR